MMRLIIINDVNYFRRVAVERLFSDFMPGGNHAVVTSVNEGMLLMKMFCRRYREVLVVGTPACETIKELTQYFRSVSQNIQIRFFIFSDTIGIKQLTHHLVVSASVIFLSSKISRASLIRFLHQRNKPPQDRCLAVKFNGNDESVISLWRRKLSLNLPYSSMTTSDYNHSRCLKNRLDVHNEYGLCLLWHFVCCAVSDYQWEVPCGSRLPACRNRRAGPAHLHP